MCFFWRVVVFCYQNNHPAIACRSLFSNLYIVHLCKYFELTSDSDQPWQCLSLRPWQLSKLPTCSAQWGRDLQLLRSLKINNEKVWTTQTIFTVLLRGWGSNDYGKYPSSPDFLPWCRHFTCHKYPGSLTDMMTLHSILLHIQPPCTCSVMDVRIVSTFKSVKIVHLVPEVYEKAAWSTGLIVPISACYCSLSLDICIRKRSIKPITN